MLQWEISFIQLLFAQDIRSDIPSIVKASATVAIFKRRLKSHFLASYWAHQRGYSTSGPVMGDRLGGQTTSVFHQATQANSASYAQRDKK